MADQSGAKPPAPDAPAAALTTAEVRAFIDRAPRCKVRIAVICQPPDTGEVVETQLVNISKTGMFLASQRLLPVGTIVEFQFRLDADLVALTGRAEIVRVAADGERGMGLRFAALDGDGGRMVVDLVDILSREPPPVPVETTPAYRALVPKPVQYDHGSLRITLTAATAAYFTYNPLLHIGVGGCFVPTDHDVPLGAGFQLDIVDAAGRMMLRCKAKVAAKQERRIGLRLVDVDRAAMLGLRAEIAKLGSAA